MAQVESNTSSAPAPPSQGLLTSTGTSSSVNGNNGSGNVPDISDSLTNKSNSYLSSTRASVDSDSDYQNSTTGQIPDNSSGGGPSRPLSRSSSTFSALSTTATKDGIEGKSVIRSHDPLGYLNWMATAGVSPLSSLNNNNNSNVNNCNNGGGSATASTGSTSSNNTDKPWQQHHQRLSQQSNSFGGNGSLNNDSSSQWQDSGSIRSNYGDAGSDIRFRSNDNSEYEVGADGDFDTNYSISPSVTASAADINDNNSEYSNHPPKVATDGPPVTLNEKIKLLRTGSVSGNAPPTAMSDMEYPAEMTYPAGSDDDESRSSGATPGRNEPWRQEQMDLK